MDKRTMRVIGLIVKVLLYMIIYRIALPILTTGGMWFALVAAVLVAGVGYLGDMMIVPRYGNWIAVASDVVLAPLLVWLLKILVYRAVDLRAGDLLLIGLLAAAVELVFHRLYARYFQTEPIKK